MPADLKDFAMDIAKLTDKEILDIPGFGEKSLLDHGWMASPAPSAASTCPPSSPSTKPPPCCATCPPTPTTSQVDALFRKARARCGIQDLHWHDARATAITRLARRLDILDLARMIGHANLGELRTYYRERAEDIAARL